MYALHLEAEDFADIFFAECIEDDFAVDTAEEFWAEMAFERFHDFVFHHFLVGADVFEDEFRAEVAGHDDDSIFEIDGLSLGVGEAAIIEELQEYVEGIGMRLFDFVEENDGVGFFHDCIGEDAAFFVADVPRRCADELGSGMFFHVFAHVEAHDGVFVIE